jgi:heme-degrading monooxygenase HmoA
MPTKRSPAVTEVGGEQDRATVETCTASTNCDRRSQNRVGTGDYNPNDLEIQGRSHSPTLSARSIRMSDSSMARELPPPYYAVIFTSRRTDVGADGYRQTAARMEELARQQSGFLGIESARGDDGAGITVSYWESREAIAAWKKDVEHLAAQESGRRVWYAAYRLRIARVEKDYAFAKPQGGPASP